MVKEIEVYRRVKRIEYFDRYLAVKVMRHWKARVMRRQFIGKCRFVSGNFFLQNGMMQGYLVYLHGLVEGGGGSGRKGRSRGGGRKSFLGFDVRQTVQLEELKMIGKEVRERFIGNEIVMEGEI